MYNKLPQVLFVCSLLPLPVPSKAALVRLCKVPSRLLNHWANDMQHVHAGSGLQMAGCSSAKPACTASHLPACLDFCGGRAANTACMGGYQDLAFQWVLPKGGIASEEDYPYRGVTNFCNASVEPAATWSGVCP